MARKGIPTEYAGVRFRSRLEATWAAFFDLVQWKWEYEPFDLKGYIPDFVIAFPRSWMKEDGTQAVRGDLVVDVKPLTSLRDLSFRGSELIRCGWDGFLLVVGAGPVSDFHGSLCIGHAVQYWDEACPDLGVDKAGLRDGAAMARQEYGDTAIYQSDGHGCGVGLSKCTSCGRIGHSAFDACVWCGLESMEWAGDTIMERVPPLDDDLTRSMWATAKNRVQWRGEFGA